MTLVEVILDKYEQNGNEWKYYGDSDKTGNRSITIQQDLYDAIGRKELNDEARHLKNQNDIVFGIDWEIHGFDIKKITYRLQDMLYYYQLDGRRPKAECIQEMRAELETRLETEKPCQWISECIQDLMRQLDNGLIPKEYCPDKEPKTKENKYGEDARKNPQKLLQESKVLNQKQGYLDALFALNYLQEPIYRRVFARRFLGDSKRLEQDKQKLQRLLISAARQFHPDVDSDPEVMSDSEVLSQLNIETYDQELLIKGPLKLLLCGKIVDFSLLPFGAVLNSDTMKYAEIPESQAIRRVVTIENKANFMSASYEEDVLYIFTHGFFAPRERAFLRQLNQALKQTDVEYLHSGDLDYGGIRIYQNIQKNVFPELQPYLMDAVTFQEFSSEVIPKDKAYLDKLKKMDVPTELEELKACILKAGGIIEQESMLGWNIT